MPNKPPPSGKPRDLPPVDDPGGDWPGKPPPPPAEPPPPRDLSAEYEEYDSILPRWLRALFAWKDVKENGVWLYQENAVTGVRRAIRINHSVGCPKDFDWLERKEAGVTQRPPPPAPLRCGADFGSEPCFTSYGFIGEDGVFHTDPSFALREEVERLTRELETQHTIRHGLADALEEAEKERDRALSTGEKWKERALAVEQERDEARDEAAEWKVLSLRECQDSVVLSAQVAELTAERDAAREVNETWMQSFDGHVYVRDDEFDVLCARARGAEPSDFAVALAERDLARQLLDGMAELIRIHQEKRA